jgi:hypothetical protein
MNDEERMKAVNELVTASVKEGHSLADIAKEFANSDDPAEKKWAESFGKTAPTTSPANLGFLDSAKKHIEETSGYQLAAEGLGILTAPHLTKRIIDRILPPPGVLVAEEQLKGRGGVPPTAGGPPPPPGGPPAEPSELDKARLQREQHNMEIARQRALRETAATDLALAKAEAQKAKLAAQQAAPTFKDPTAQRLFEISQAQQAAKAQPMMGQTLSQPSISAPSIPPTAATTQTQPLTTGRPNPYMNVGSTPSAPVAPPSVQSLDKAFAASVAPPAVQPTVAPVAEAVAPPQEAPKPPAKAPAKPKIAMPEGWGKGMSWLVNQYGVTGAKDFIDVHNKGNPYTSYDDFMAKYKSVMVKPSYSDIPKGVRKERGIIPREEMKAVVPPPSGGGFVPGPGGVGNLRSSSGGDIRKLNPMKLME